MIHRKDLSIGQIDLQEKPSREIRGEGVIHNALQSPKGLPNKNPKLIGQKAGIIGIQAEIICFLIGQKGHPKEGEIGGVFGHKAFWAREGEDSVGSVDYVVS